MLGRYSAHNVRPDIFAWLCTSWKQRRCSCGQTTWAPKPKQVASTAQSELMAQYEKGSNAQIEVPQSLGLPPATISKGVPLTGNKLCPHPIRYRTANHHKPVVVG